MISQYITRPEWLRLTEEAAIDSDRAICDPHHHLWDRENNRYLVEDLHDDLRSGHNIVSTVFIECGARYRADGPESFRPVGETEFVVGEAERAAGIAGCSTKVAAGIVGHVDLRFGTEVGAVLQAHIEAGAGRFRGIRHCVSADPDPDVPQHRILPPLGQMADPTYREGFACLEPLGISFEAWLYHPQIPDVIDLARSFPGITIILDHVGGPIGVGSYAGRRDAIFEEWKSSIDELAGLPNVLVKLGGLGMTVCGFGWEKRDQPPSSQDIADAIAPYVQHCVDRFGVERAMFESNFPVDKQSCGYGIMWNALKRIAEKYNQTERDAMFHDNALRIYRL